MVSQDLNVQAFYEVMRENGETHYLAEMLAFQQFPATRSNTDYMRGRLSGDQFGRTPQDQALGRNYRLRANAAGVSTVGKYYFHSVARFPGDPEAWHDSIDDVKRLCEKRGWGMRGYTSVDRVDRDEDLVEQPYNPAPDIVAERMASRVAADPGLGSTPQKLQRLKEEVRESLIPSWAKT